MVSGCHGDDAVEWAVTPCGCCSPGSSRAWRSRSDRVSSCLIPARFLRCFDKRLANYEKFLKKSIICPRKDKINR